MKTKSIIGLAVISLLVLTGCSNSAYEDCIQNCHNINQWNFAYNTTCEVTPTYANENYYTILKYPKQVECMKYDDNKLTQACHNDCK